MTECPCVCVPLRRFAIFIRFSEGNISKRCTAVANTDDDDDEDEDEDEDGGQHRRYYCMLPITFRCRWSSTLGVCQLSGTCCFCRLCVLVSSYLELVSFLEQQVQLLHIFIQCNHYFLYLSSSF